MTRPHRKGLSLLAGGLLSFIWLFACPAYTLEGSMTALSTSNSADTPGTIRHEQQVFPETGHLWTGFIVIWSLVGAACYGLPLRAFAKLFAPVEASPNSSPRSRAPQAPRGPEERTLQ